MRATRTLVAGFILGVVLPGCATVDIQQTRVVTGQITDESGRPVANSPVVIVCRMLEFVTLRLAYEERGRQEVKASTDAEGRYRIQFVPAAVGNDFHLFFHDKTGFDRVKYRPPEPLDITQPLNRNRTLIVNQVLRFDPAWTEVERQTAFHGADSEKGRILRKHGLPEKRETSGTGDAAAEVWWYYADGVSYWFTGDKLMRTHEFTPIPGAAPTK